MDKAQSFAMQYGYYDKEKKKACCVGYNAGYKQAEQDLALTWEDMSKIDAIILDVNNEFAVDYSKEISRQKFYEEVLRRFNEIRKK